MSLKNIGISADYEEIYFDTIEIDNIKYDVSLTNGKYRQLAIENNTNSDFFIDMVIPETDNKIIEVVYNDIINIIHKEVFKNEN